MMPQRLYRSRDDRMIAGICGGVARYFGVDSTVVRLFFVLAAIFSGGLIIPVYLVVCLVVPEEPVDFAATGPVGGSLGAEGAAESSTFGEASSFGSGEGATGFGSYTYLSDEQRQRRSQWIGWALLVLGLLILMSNLHLLSWLQLNVTWPLFLILAGVFLLLRQRQRV